LLSGSAVILVLTLATHTAGRIAGFCCPYEADSFNHAVEAYKFWSPGGTLADLIPDKPAGQALLTGWCYRIWPGPPSRLTLVPIESAFLLGAAGVFLWLALRLFGRRTAIALTFFSVLAYNVYNAVDLVTDGFNLNESYLALPMLTAVFAHLTIVRPWRHGFVRGLGIGLALTIKQAPIGLLAVLVVHGCVFAAIRKRWAEAAAAATASLIGMAAAIAPLTTWLWARGWLPGHWHDLTERTSTHLGVMATGLRDWHYLVPLAPALWWIALGAAGLLAARLPRGPAEARPPASHAREASFVLLWLAAEIIILRSMTLPASHYYQPIVAPLTLAAGFGITALARCLKSLRTRDRVLAWRWVTATTIALVVVAAMPLWAATWARARTFSYRAEVNEFRRWAATWNPGAFGLPVLRRDVKP
jgi:hypothetical protein